MNLEGHVTLLGARARLSLCRLRADDVSPLTNPLNSSKKDSLNTSAGMQQSDFGISRLAEIAEWKRWTFEYLPDGSVRFSNL
jgi:hypothetical protein